MEIAVIGSGIAGLSAAWLLSRKHRVRLFEKAGRLGGHSHTVAHGPLALDTGFLVFNRETYPNLCRLFEALGVASHESDMSFSVRCEACDLEYCGTGFSGLFAQKSNLLRPSFLRMLKEIVRFNRQALEILDGPPTLTLSSYLDSAGFSDELRNHYLGPMAAAVWSSGTAGIDAFPAPLLVRFFRNHGFLGVTTQFRWRTVTGGSRTYVARMAEALEGRVHTSADVRRIRRGEGDVEVVFGDGASQRFDRVVVATHADEALALLADPTPDEKSLLGPWRYSRNDTFLHTDGSFLPRRKAAQASWNYGLEDCRARQERVTVTYHLNRLQGLAEPVDYLVTLNPERQIAEGSVIARVPYTHPVYTAESTATQALLPCLDGQKGTYFCGAYFGNGFHEDGLVAGMRVAEALGVPFP